MSKRKTSSKADEPYIEQLKKEIDEFKFQIDELCENELPHLGAASPDRLSVYQRATGLKAELSSLNQKLEGISLSDSGLSTKVFESKKGAEKQRLNKLQRRLDHISEQLEPDEVEEDYFRTLASDDDRTKSEHSKEVGNTRNEDETEVDEDDEYDGDAISADGSGQEEGCVLAETLTVYKAEQDGDLSFEKGEQLEILEQSEDGWWYARNKVGKEGVIPSTLIKIIDAQEMFKDKAGGTVEKTGKRSGRELWNILKEKKPTTKEASINDVLKAMKAMPSGFRTSTLGTWYQKEEYRTATWVIPKLTSSKLQFRDLHWDGINKKLREYPVKMCRTFSLVNVRCVPPLGAGVEVLSRHVYVAIWDEKKIISNIHRIRAIPLEKESNWTFTPKMGKNIPSLYDGDFVARVNSDDRKLSILFEFNYTYKRTSTGQQGDISCGWASFPLFEMDGTPYPNRTFEININGGTPFETDVPLDPTTNLAASGTLMQSLIRGNQQPRMVVRSTGMNKTSKETYDMLPSTIVTCQKHALFIGFYRQHAAITFCRDDNIPSDYVCDSLLSYFPRALSFPDLMDALKMVWDEKLKNSLTRTQRKDLGQLLKTFKQSFTESAFGLMQCSNIPPFIWADDAAEKARYSFIQTFLMQKDPLGNLLNPDYRHKPLLVNKLTFTVLSQHCVDPPPLDQASLAI